MSAATGAILVTTDLSPLGDAALAHGADLARATKSPILLFSVVEVPAAPSPLYAHYYRVPTPEQQAKAHATLLGELEQRAARVRTMGVEVECCVVEGDPSEEIIRIAATRAPRMLVISTHGRTGLKRYFLGSVAERVLRGTTCPVLFVR